jgi:hypothetical protein
MQVSVITPSYNQASYLRHTIESVLGQDYPNIEYLIVDGGSTDGSPGIIQQYAPRLSWWISEPDSGQGEAINKGIAHAHGEIIAWLNSDDFYLPGAVTAAVRSLQANAESAFVFGDMQAVDADGRVTNHLRYRDLTLQDLLCFQIIGQPAVFIRRTHLESAGALDPSFHALLDHHLWIRLAAGGPIHHEAQVWAAARYHPAAKNLSRTDEFGREAFRILDWAAKDVRLAPVMQGVAGRARASAHRVSARYLLDGNKPASALGEWVRAFGDHPATALARFNILVSALLQLAGLGVVRREILRRRQDRLSR